MDIIETHTHKMRYCIDQDAPEEYMKRWGDLKLKCESGENKSIVEMIKDNCKLKQNKELPYLLREEGGLGGNDNSIHKQMRFRNEPMMYYPHFKDNDIILDEILSTNTEKWTYEELDDTIHAFTTMANDIIGASCINGCIELRNHESYSDNY